jgi:DNA-binding NarL/FixJ family response regulator
METAAHHGLILLVEDDQNFGIVLREFLSLNDFEVTLAKNGMEGFEKFKKSNFDLCILDVMCLFSFAHKAYVNMRKSLIAFCLCLLYFVYCFLRFGGQFKTVIQLCFQFFNHRYHLLKDANRIIRSIHRRHPSSEYTILLG